MQRLSKYSKYINLVRYDRKGQKCSVMSHLNILKNSLREEIFLKILSQFSPSIKYLQPVNKPNSAFFRIFWPRPDGELRRSIGLATRKNYLGINIGMSVIPNYSELGSFTKKYFVSNGLPFKIKDGVIPKKNILGLIDEYDTEAYNPKEKKCFTIYIIDDEYLDSILKFINDYNSLFNKVAIKQ